MEIKGDGSLLANLPRGFTTLHEKENFSENLHTVSKHTIPILTHNRT